MGTVLRGIASCMLLSVIAGCGLKPAPRTNPAIVETPLPGGVTGRAYSATIALEEGKGSTPFTWSLSDVPQALGWLTIDSTTGALGGTPTAAVVPGASFTVTVTDIIKRTDSAVFTLTVRDPPVIVTESLPDGMVDAPYNATVAAEGGAPPYTWSLRDVPDALGWLTIDAATGALGGTPTVVVQPGVTFTVAVTDANQVEGTRALALATRTCTEGDPIECLVPSGTQCLVGTAICENGQPGVCQGDHTSNSTQACGAACGACDSTADRCDNGQCMCGKYGDACPGGQVCCSSATAGASCFDAQTDVSHCGSCAPCPPGANTSDVACNGGTCSYQCYPGWGHCSGDTGPCDTDQTDPLHCGSECVDCQGARCQPVAVGSYQYHCYTPL